MTSGYSVFCTMSRALSICLHSHLNVAKTGASVVEKSQRMFIEHCTKHLSVMNQ